MTGVTILSQHTFYAFQVIGVFLMGLGFIAGFCCFLDDYIKTGIIFFIVGIFGLYNIINPIPVFKEIQYQVTIDNNVKLQDFNNHYKIISQDGNIYTVELEGNKR